MGRWTLAQICHHLELALRLSMDGVPVKYPWPVRRLFGPLARQLMFWRGRIPEGVRVPGLYLPGPGLDAPREAGALRGTIDRFGSFVGASMSIRYWADCRRSSGDSSTASTAPTT